MKYKITVYYPGGFDSPKAYHTDDYLEVPGGICFRDGGLLRKFRQHAAHNRAAGEVVNQR